MMTSKWYKSNFVCSILPSHFTDLKKKYCRENIFILKWIYLQALRKHEKDTVELLKSVRVSVDVNEVLDQILIYWLDYLLTSLHSSLTGTDHDTNKNQGRENVLV